LVKFRFHRLVGLAAVGKNTPGRQPPKPLE